MQKITPFLWFNDQAEEAVNFYTSVFRDSTMGTVSRYSDAGPGEMGSVMTATFEIHGMEFVALNGGLVFTFNPAISFVIRCEDQTGSITIGKHWQRAEGMTSAAG